MPVLILAGIVGLVLGNLRIVAEKWLENFVRRLVHGKKPNRAAGSTDPDTDRLAMVADVPHCPNCNKVMVSRVAKRGSVAGRNFWGCPEYPRCRGTRPGE